MTLVEPAGLYPADLLDQPALGECDRTWWVLHVRPRQEKQLALYLQKHDIPFYLPLIHHNWNRRTRVMTSEVPLYPGYLFLYGDNEERISALASSRVVRSLDVPDPEKLEHDLRQTWRLISSGMAISPEEKLTPGTPVEIVSGPLFGLKGSILRSAGGHRFVVQIDFIHRGASVLIEDSRCLAPLDTYAAILR